MVTAGNDDLGLSLSLSPCYVPRRHLPLQLNLKPPSSSSASTPSPPPSMPCHQKPLWSDLLLLSENHGARDVPPRPILRGIDVNHAPLARESEEEAGVSSPNSTLSSVSGKRIEREQEQECSRGMSDEEDGGGSRKKLRLSKDQSAVLEETFKEHNTLNPKQKMALAKQLNLRPRQVEVWFQNRRARTKLKQTEVDCEFLKRCCETLTEENRRLHKEVQELRALKLSPQIYMQMTPPTTLTMCPSCERIANSTATATSTTTTSSPATMPPEHNQFLHHRPISASPWMPIPPQRSH